MIIYWYFFFMGLLAIILAILCLVIIREAIMTHRFAIRAAYSSALAFSIIGLLLTISAIILEALLG